MSETWFLATLWLGLALIATLLSIWLRIATALSEIVVGTVAQLIIGALISSTVLAACFINDLGTVLALGLIFAPFTIKTLLIAAPGVFMILLLGKMATKFTCVYPVTKYFKNPGKQGMYTTSTDVHRLDLRQCSHSDTDCQCLFPAPSSLAEAG
ncbi:MAG: hypothetical protein A2277_09795 [Desulfobacterales bacterium RIFOXYA12_FULL_46_15]|nr:MAG: hypothetical protein A2277_09795 [Desulfobacterales bacterium RIFOXYA12_FULL_46_15]